MEKRLFIISNRLPINIDTENNSVNLSSGGLVSAISSYLEKKEKQHIKEFDKKFWLGVPGCTPGIWSGISNKIPAEGYEYLPVFLNKKIYDGYYNGMSNSVLWALFHYFPSFAEFNAQNYRSYQQVNNEFLSVVMRYLQPNDVVWIHDYHLLPLAGLIRKLMPEITIGFFLHIPFPSYEIFRIMPKRWQRDLLEGMLGADLIGFHTMDYAMHFMKSVQMILGLDQDKFIIKYQNRLIKIGAFPISIDFNKFYNAYDDKEVQAQRKLMKHQFPDRKIIFSADRLDYTKGVYNRLKAYEYFLTSYPEYHEKVVFVMVIVPSRDAISKYAERKKMIDEYIGNLNSRIGNFKWQPVIYQYNSLEFHELVAMYTSCDLALITPIRDGMNLVAKEFVASRKDQKGVLVLSELTGTARELTEALTINPNDTEEIAEKIKMGLEMSEKGQRQRIRTMQEKIRNYDVIDWASDFFAQLYQIRRKRKEYEVHFFGTAEKNTLIEKYRAADKRLLLLDYDGTLTPLVSLPELAKPDAQLLSLLEHIATDSQNTVYIISGRDADTLQAWLGHLPIHIIAEHGALLKHPGMEWKTSTAVHTDWKSFVLGVMEKYVQYCPGSMVENKKYSIAWHYRNADPDESFLYSVALQNELQPYADSLNVQTIKGNKVIEVRNKGVHKGEAVRSLLSKGNYDFILACGDDTTDEDMFYQLATVENAYTIKIGDQASYAKFNLHTTNMVLALLDNLSHVRKIKKEMV